MIRIGDRQVLDPIHLRFFYHTLFIPLPPIQLVHIFLGGHNASKLVPGSFDISPRYIILLSCYPQISFMICKDLGNIPDYLLFIMGVFATFVGMLKENLTMSSLGITIMLFAIVFLELKRIKERCNIAENVS